jgi:myo-inositol-1(or 4)-monophosphatase
VRPDQVGELAALLDEVADRIADALTISGDWGLAGTIPGQHHSDIAADEVAVDHLVAAGVGVLSEETGLHHPEREVIVVVDPLDGSTNAAHGIPWYAISLCAVDGDGPLASLVVDIPRDRRWAAVRGRGASRDGEPIASGTVTRLEDAIIAVSGLPPRHLGWRQFRALGASALDLCLVADGTLDGFVDCSVDAHGPWDYLGAMLVCHEAGAIVGDVHGRDLVVIDHTARRTPVAAGTPELHAELVRGLVSSEP